MNPADSNPAELAHARLIAYADECRRGAEQLPELSPELRNALQREVERYARGLAPDRPSPTESTRGWRHWLAPTAWLAAATAFVILAFVRITTNPERGNSPEMVGGETAPFDPRATKSPVLYAADPPAPASGSGGGTAAGAEADLAEILGPAPAAAPTTVARAVRPASAKSATALAAGAAPVASPTVRVRGAFRASKTSVAPERSPLLRFEVVRVGENVELRDEDGSVFSGRVQPIPPGAETPTSWSYEAAGTSKKLGAPVAITGNFTLPTPAPAPAPAGAPAADPAAAEPVVDSFLDLPFTASLLVNGEQSLEIEAVPEVPAP